MLAQIQKRDKLRHSVSFPSSPGWLHKVETETMP